MLRQLTLPGGHTSVFLRMWPPLSNEHGPLSLPRTTKLFLLEGRPFFMGAIYTSNESNIAETQGCARAGFLEMVVKFTKLVQATAKPN